jgi:hypothetical protein
MFEHILHALATPRSLPITTGFSAAPLEDAVEEFLIATWPYDECWNEWRGYLLLRVGGSIAPLEEAAKQKIDAAA